MWFNPRLESRDFMIPGVIALLLLVVTTNLSSMGIVREKELGTLEQLNVTPLRRWELIVGKLLPYALIGIIDVALVLAVAVWWFEVPMRGSPPLLFAMTLVVPDEHAGTGAVRLDDLVHATAGDDDHDLLFLMPMVLLSGFVLPIENMPEVIQPITYLPAAARYFLVILRSIFLKGVGPRDLPAAGARADVVGAGRLALAVARSSKRAA